MPEYVPEVVSPPAMGTPSLDGFDAAFRPVGVAFYWPLLLTTSVGRVHS